MGRGLGSVQREVLEWLNQQFQDDVHPSWHRTLDQFVRGAGHRGNPHYPYPHLVNCCCRVCWVQQYGLIDTKDNFGRYQPENWGKGHWVRFYPQDEKRYQDYLSSLNLPSDDSPAKRESYRRAIRSLIDRKYISVSADNRLVPYGHPDSCSDRWRKGDIRPKWRKAIVSFSTDEWQHPVEMCKAIWDAEWKNEASDEVNEVVQRQIDSTIFYHYYFRSQLNELRKKGLVEILRTTSPLTTPPKDECWVCDGTRMEGARIVGVRAKR